MTESANLPPLAANDDTNLAGLAWRSAAAYEELALEYYVRERHPTCANFDVLQDASLPDLRPVAEGTNGSWLEVGCGQGRLDRLVKTNQVILSDISPSMLALAQRRTDDRISCRLMDAFQLPFEDGSLQGVVAFLADPYNHSTFFAQSRRVLRPGGCLAFTLPNHDWAVAVRAALGHPLDETHFSHRDKKNLRVPSLTRSISLQCGLLEALGFRVESAYTVGLVKCPEVVPSHHVVLAARILGCDPYDVPLLDVYVCSKKGQHGQQSVGTNRRGCSISEMRL
jgi:Methylase involved in ubiquinone/menaquinone biosynthesis